MDEEINNMKTIVTAVAVMAFATTAALAQSSGNFTYGNTGGLHCVVNSGSGAITGGATCSAGSDCSTGTCVPIPASGTCGGTIVAGIKTNSGSGNVFVIRPSAVIGLLTNVTVQRNATINVGTSSAFAGVDFDVQVTPPAGQPVPCMSPNFPITYAARFIQISTNLFNVLGTLCTGTAPNPFGVTTAVGCFISFSESTVSAHSFDWVAGDPGASGAGGSQSNCGSLHTGVYGIAANWRASLGNTGISQSLTCVGPVNLTVTQNKIFSFNTVN
jgi:hypothetical protein